MDSTWLIAGIMGLDIGSTWVLSRLTKSSVQVVSCKGSFSDKTALWGDDSTASVLLSVAGGAMRTVQQVAAERYVALTGVMLRISKAT